MSISGHDKTDMFLGEIEKRRLQFLEQRRCPLDLLFDIKPQVERNLIVSAPRGVQLRARLADFSGEGALDVHVDVLKRFVPLKFSGLDFLLNLAQPGFDFLPFRGGDNPRFGRGGGMSNGTSDVMPIETAIERN